MFLNNNNYAEIIYRKIKIYKVKLSIMLAVMYKAKIRKATLRKRYLHVRRIVDATTVRNPHDYIDATPTHGGTAMRCNYVIGRSSYIQTRP